MSVSINGTSGLIFNDASTQNTAAKTGMVNRIINGDFRIDQRNAGASVTSSGPIYTVDRWAWFYTSGSGHSIQQVSDAPTGFTNSLKVTTGTGASPSAAQQNIVWQPIEGYNVADFGIGTSGAATVAVSFWVKSSLTGTFNLWLQNAAGTIRAYPTTYTVNAANTWEQKTITVTLDTSAVGTWSKTNGAGLLVGYSLGCGSNFVSTANSWQTGDYKATSGATNVIATSGATFQVSGVQLEKGSTATSFDYRPYGTELQLCQRYFISYGGSASYERFGTCICSGTTGAIAMMPFPVEMRTVPTFGYSALANLAVYTGTAVNAVSAVGGDSPSPKVGMVSLTSSGLSTNATYQFLANNSTAARVTWSAEL